MPVVQLPPGCASLAFADGGRPAVADRPGGYVNVSPERAAMINSMDGNGTAGLVNGNPGQFTSIRGRKGRRCPVDGKRWFSWTTHCHRCGAATEPE